MSTDVYKHATFHENFRFLFPNAEIDWVYPFRLEGHSEIIKIYREYEVPVNYWYA